MSKDDFVKLTGDSPEDMFGGDWENILAEWDEAKSHELLGGCIGDNVCYACKDGF